MSTPSLHAWIQVVPTPIAIPLQEVLEAEDRRLRLTKLVQASTSLLFYLAMVSLLDQKETGSYSAKVEALLISWLGRPLSWEEVWLLLREALRPSEKPRQWIPRGFYYAPNGRYTSVHIDIQRLMKLRRLLETEAPALSSTELEALEREIAPEPTLYRMLSKLDALWGWEICTAQTPPEEGHVRAWIWRGPRPFEDRRPWEFASESCLLFHPAEAVGAMMPPFLMAGIPTSPQEMEGCPPLLAKYVSGKEGYRDWIREKSVNVRRGLERCRAFVDEYGELNDAPPAASATVRWETDLSARQREIVRTHAPHLLVVAGAGSGKTRVLTYRIAHLIQEAHLPFDAVMAVTFTNRAAREMKHRLGQLLGSSVDTDEMWVGTFHAICLRILKEEITRLGYRPAFAIVDREDQELLIEETKADLRYQHRQNTRERIRAIVEALAPSPAQQALKNRQFHRALSLYRRRPQHELSVDELIGIGIARWGSEWGLQTLQSAKALAPDHPMLDFLLESFETYLVFQMEASELAEQISHYKDRLWTPEKALEHADTVRDRAIAAVYAAYQAKLKANNLLDFGDLIMLTLGIFQQFPEVLERYQQQFQHILVDEFQDINHAQERWLATLGTKACVFGVGDADQLIYEWRGANVETILEYGQKYDRLVLEENYRSGRRILEAANQVIQHNTLRQEKRLRSVLKQEGQIWVCPAEDEGIEAEFVADQVAWLVSERGLNHADIALLYRINAKSERFRQALQKREIPHRVIGGQRFYEQPEIRHVLNYLRILHNPYDSVSLKQIMRYQLDPAWAAAVEDFARESDGSFFDALRQLEKIPALDAFSQDQIRALLNQLRLLYNSYHDVKDAVEIVSLLRNVVQGCMLQPPHLPPMTLTYLQLLSLEELFSIAQHFQESEKEHSIQAFLEFVALFSRQDDLQMGDTDTVTLMTMHSGKGLEFEAVFVVGCVDGLIPLIRRTRVEGELSPQQQEQMELRQLEEERRLFYVSMTRAKSYLYLTYPAQRQTTSSTIESVPSRFLDEIPRSSYRIRKPK